MLEVKQIKTVKFENTVKTQSDTHTVKLSKINDIYHLQAFIYTEKFGSDNPLFIFSHHLKSLNEVNKCAVNFGVEFIEEN